MENFNLKNFEFFSLKKNNCVSESSLPLFLILACEKLEKVAHFTNNIKSMINLKEKIQSFGSNIEIIMFPEFDCRFFSNISPTKEILSERMKTLYKVLFPRNKKTIFIGSYETLITQIIPKKILKEKRLSLNKDCSSSYENIKNFLKENMFERSDFVRNKGEYAIRGEVIDIFSPNHENPVRILFDFDDIDTISFFDIETQNEEYYVSHRAI